MQQLLQQVRQMQNKTADDSFDPSEFEEPELYESIKILKWFDKNYQKKSNLHDLKKCSTKEKQKEREQIRSKLKRPYYDLEKIMNVNKNYGT